VGGTAASSGGRRWPRSAEYSDALEGPGAAVTMLTDDFLQDVKRARKSTTNLTTAKFIHDHAHCHVIGNKLATVRQ